MEDLDSTDTLAFGISDHFAIIAKIRITVKTFESKNRIRKRCFGNYDPIAFKNEVSCLPWEKLDRSKGPHIMAGRFEEMILTVLNKHAPVRDVKISKNYKHGLQTETKLLMKDQNI